MKIKKIAALLLVASMSTALVACGGNTETPDTQVESQQPETNDSVDTQSQDDTVETEATDDSVDNAGAQEDADTSTEITVADGVVSVLASIWETYTDPNEQFPAGGGDANNMNPEGPGKVDPSDVEYMDATLAVPADAAAYVDDAASLMHMMNANNFTGGAFHVADAANVDAFIAAVKDNVMNRQWMCGFPQKLYLIKVDDFTVVMAFGENTIMETFRTHLLEVFADAQFVVDENLDL